MRGGERVFNIAQSNIPATFPSALLRPVFFAPDLKAMGELQTEQKSVSLPPDAPLPRDECYPFSDYDVLVPAIYTSVVLTFKSSKEQGDFKKDVVDRLETGLARSLFHIPLVAGQIASGSSPTPFLKVKPGNSVSLFIKDARGNTGIDYDFLESQSFQTNSLDGVGVLPPTSAPGWYSSEGTPMFALQITFIRGCVLLAFSFHHWLFDVASIDKFLSTFALNAKMGNQPVHRSSDVLCLDRSIFEGKQVSPAEKEALARNERHWKCVPSSSPPTGFLNEISPPLKSRLYMFPAAKLSMLKEHCRPQATDSVPFVSSYDCMLAATWQAITRARSQEGVVGRDTPTSAFAPSDLRRRASRVPSNYFGNGFIMSKTDAMPISELLGANGLAQGAKAIRKDLLNADLDELRRTTMLRKSVRPDERLDHRACLVDGMDVMATSWRSVNIDDYYFGPELGHCVALRTPQAWINANVLFFPKRRDDVSGDIVNVVLEDRIHDMVARDGEFLRWAEML